MIENFNFGTCTSFQREESCTKEGVLSSFDEVAI